MTVHQKCCKFAFMHTHVFGCPYIWWQVFVSFDHWTVLWDILVRIMSCYCVIDTMLLMYSHAMLCCLSEITSSVGCWMAWQGFAGGNVAGANRRCTFKRLFSWTRREVHELGAGRWDSRLSSLDWAVARRATLGENVGFSKGKFLLTV